MRSVNPGRIGLPSFSRVLLCAFFTTALPAATVDFKAQIQPVLTASCVPCHQAAKPSGGLALDSAEAVAQGGKSGAAVTAGDVSHSLLYQRISATDKSVRMPLGAAALPGETVALIR
ncbi:MAG TPA: c-type cytochrome domain-containing protein, partial [Bryobacteraceae bacterium]|nr:c-type cytochrome domain-containing protein [Bryobacteraceae bacterium]